MKKVSIHPKKPYKDLTLAKTSIVMPEPATKEEVGSATNTEKPYKVLIESDDIFTKLSSKFGRMLSIRIDRDLKTEISVYGVEHFERFRGKTPDEAIALALS